MSPMHDGDPAGREPRDTRHPARTVLAWGAALFLLGAGIFFGTLQHRLVWDDSALTTLVREKTDRGGLAALLVTEFRLQSHDPTGYYRPVVLFSLWLDQSAARVTGYAHHLQNIFLHAAATALAFLLYLKMHGSLAGAVAGAALFALHPAHTESVAFVSGRTDVLSTIFVLLSVLFWLRVRVGSASAAGEAALSLVAFLAACLSKEVAFMLPVALLVWDACDTPGSCSGSQGWWGRNRLWLAGWALVLAVVLVIRWHLGIPLGSGRAQGEFFGVVPAMLAEYARLLLVPWPLNSWYMPAQVRLSALNIACAAVCIIAALLAPAGARRRPGCTALSWTLIFLLPVLGAVNLDSAVIAERFLYLPSVGLGMVVAFWYGRAAASAKSAALSRAALLSVLALYAAATIARVPVWKDELSLFSEITRSSPASWSAYNGLGLARLRAGDLEGAVQSFQTAAMINPHGTHAHHNLGNALLRLGRRTEAISSYTRALEVDSTSPKAAIGYAGLGLAQMQGGDLEGAVKNFRTALERDPRASHAHDNLGNALLQLGQRAGAIASYRRALEIDPSSVDARFNLARALAEDGRADESIREYEEVLRLDPDAVDALNNLAWTLVETRGADAAEVRRAIGYARRACELTGYREAQYLDTLATAQAAAGERGEALATAERAVAAARASGDKVLAGEIAKKLEHLRSPR